MKRIVAIFCAICLCLGLSAFANSESLISLSYLNKTVKPELQELIDGRASFSNDVKSVSESAIEAMSRDGVIKSVSARLRGNLQLKGLHYYSTSAPEVISVSRDDVIAGLPGTMVILKSGAASVINNSVINITVGAEAKAGSAVKQNNSYFIPTSDGAGLRITSDTAKMVVDGVYRIVSLRARAMNFEIADALKEMNLFRGSKIGYELSRGATRAEALVMLLRLLGEEDDAERYTGTHPFTDVDTWAEKYVAYAYAKGYTNGISKTKFGSSNMTTASHYMTFVLRALGYDDTKGDFKWDKSLDFAVSVGNITASEKKNIEKTAFLRDHMAYLSYYSLFAKLKAQDVTLLEKLISDGTVNRSAAENAISSVSSPRL